MSMNEERETKTIREGGSGRITYRNQGNWGKRGIRPETVVLSAGIVVSSGGEKTNHKKSLG